MINLLASLLDTPALLLPLSNLSALLLAPALLRVSRRKGRRISLRCSARSACLILRQPFRSSLALITWGRG